MIILENESIKAIFDERGRLTSYVHKEEDLELLASPARNSFFMNLSGDGCFETLVEEEEQEIIATHTALSASFHMNRLKTDRGRKEKQYVDISLTLHVKIEGESLLFTADVNNRTDLYITDFEYPRVGVIKTLGNGKPTLYWPQEPGKLIMNVGETISNSEPHRDVGHETMAVTYPGGAMMGTFGLMDKERCLFMTTEDPEFIACELKIIGSYTDHGAITMTVDKHLCCKNTSMTTAPVRVELYRGKWYRSAERYLEWIRPYRRHHGHEVPRWIREMSGFLLVVMKMQYGYEHYSYDDLPKIYEMAKAHGFDTLGLFGWYDSGHDNMYPDLKISESMGGEASFKENIKKVQDAGGRVMLYYQGHLIDPLSDFYQNGIGKDIQSINIWGYPYIDNWSFAHNSFFLAYYTGKTFTQACPACPEWRSLMVEKERWLSSFGVDGVLYDQIGGLDPFPCFNENHPHEGNNPARAMSCGQARLVADLQDESKKISPQFAFMSEMFTDIYSGSLDLVHGCPNYPGEKNERDYQIGGDRGSVIFPDFQRYIFPEAVVTGRHSSPNCPKRYVNYLFLYHYIPQMGVRFKACHDDIQNDVFAEERIYCAQVTALRQKYVKEIPYATYTDVLGIENDDPYLMARGFASDDALYVTLWNDSDEARTPNIRVQGRTLQSFETVDGCSSIPVELGPQSVAIAVYR